MEGIKELLETNKKMLESQGASLETILTEQKNLLNRVGDLEVRMNPRGGVGPIPGLESEAKNFSFFRAVKAIMTNDWSAAGFEREVFSEARKKAMSIGTDTSMGYFVPNEILAGYIELLRAEAVVMQMGATVLSNLQGVPVTMPKQTGGATAYWVN